MCVGGTHRKRAIYRERQREIEREGGTEREGRSEEVKDGGEETENI